MRHGDLTEHYAYTLYKEARLDMEGLKGTKTEANLKTALGKECLAAIEYSLFGDQAAKDGYQQIKDIFLETSGNERTHAHLWLKWLSPDDKLPNTLVNLEASTAEEQFEGGTMYPQYAKEAKEEGFDAIAQEFAGVAEIEMSHAARFNKLIDNIKDDEVYERPEPVLWQCLVCGHLQKTKKAPEVCPVCKHPQSYFQIAARNY